VIDLDDGSALHAADPSDMLGSVAALGSDARTAYATGRELSGPPDVEDVDAMVFCGMGGSAVSGDLIKEAFRSRLPVPVVVNRSPDLPAFAGPDTLVVASSYSGNTAETLAAFGQAVECGCRIVAITSGGALGDACSERKLPRVSVPGGFQPRAALGHLAFAAIGALEAAGLLTHVGDEVEESARELDVLANELGPAVGIEDNAAKRTAGWIADRVPVIWGAEGIGGVAAMRWKTQMNENGKVPAFYAAMSELDHNEVVGWVRPYGERFAVVVLRHAGEPDELAARFPLSAEIAEGAGADVREVHARGRAALARLMTLIMVGDLTSCYVGLRRGIDPTPVAAIDRLKAALAGRAS
jgi:glucose/mannose-6-phosphate isomerase